jgi:hypothetical protein
MTSLDASLTAYVGTTRADHQATLAAVADLRADLDRLPELRARERHTTEHGTKGALVDLVVTLSSSGSLAALARVIRLWLGRDRRRSLTVTFQQDGKETVIKVGGDPISIENLNKALSAVTHLDANAKSE